VKKQPDADRVILEIEPHDKLCMLNAFGIDRREAELSVDVRVVWEAGGYKSAWCRRNYRNQSKQSNLAQAQEQEAEDLLTTQPSEASQVSSEYIEFHASDLSAIGDFSTIPLSQPDSSFRTL